MPPQLPSPRGAPPTLGEDPQRARYVREQSAKSDRGRHRRRGCQRLVIRDKAPVVDTAGTEKSFVDSKPAGLGRAPCRKLFAPHTVSVYRRPLQQSVDTTVLVGHIDGP